ncbi:integrin alpha-6-like [Aplochiton taeniatus]
MSARMEVRWELLVCAQTLVFLLASMRLSAFNLDTENVVLKRGEPGSLFGFSLAMHRQLKPQDKRILLVGAPTAKAMSKQKAKVTGGLYNCDINAPAASCTRVDFDNEENLGVESKENQWMGVTVSSQGPGGKILTCAHRYQRRQAVGRPEESRDITGRCYVLSQDLSINPQANEDGGNWRFCDGRLRGHERFGSCQQGMSASFTKDYHYLIFGAPGAYNWKGVVRIEQNNNTLIEMGLYDDGPFEVGDENILDPNVIPVPASSYLGFSLDSGHKLTKKGQLTVVAGAPRANHSGGVVLLKIASQLGRSLVEEHVLEGQGLASSFGYDLAVLDINGDGWEDIVVGAPQYFEKDKELGGAVYVYLNKEGAWSQVKAIRLTGPQDSMFGLSVENMGDINLDGFHDFAVGAPYDDGGAGKVYIYHGAAKFSTEPAQVLTAQPGTRMFGYSLAGNMDLDLNSYPDLAVGSLSDGVFIYRSRTVVSIKKEVKTSPKEIDFTKKNCGNSICVDVEACFSYTAKPATYNPQITVKYAFLSEAERKKQGLPPRVTFSSQAPGDSSYESTGTLTLGTQGRKECITQKLTLQDNVKDKLRGIPIDISIEIQTAKRKRRQAALLRLAPVLNAKEPKTTRAEIAFLKEGCGSDNVCESNLQVKHRFCYKEPNKDVFPPLPVEKGLPVVSLSDQKDIALEITVTNLNGDDSYEAALVANFPPTVSYSTFRLANADTQVTCSANTNGSEAQCELGNPFKRDAQVTFYIILSTADITLNTTELEIDLRLETTSNQKMKEVVKAKARVVVELLLSLTGQAQPSQVFFTGEVKGESAMKIESDIGSPIKYQFRVINLGKPLKTFGTAFLVVRWPKETAEGKWLLYLTDITSTGVDNRECTPWEQVDPLKVKEENSGTRKRRAIEGAQAEEGTIALLKEERKFKILSCDDGAKCVDFRCPLVGLDSNAVITFHSRLWNSTLLEEYSKLNYLDVIVKASLHVAGTADNMVLRNAETQVRVTAFPAERKADRIGGLPWWIIVVAILLGLLLLALLAFLLWKCGFFERAKYEDRVPSYNAVRIRKDEMKPGKDDWEHVEKKPWITSWHDNKHYS